MNSLALMQQVLLEAPALMLTGLNPERSLEERADMVSAESLADFEALLKNKTVTKAVAPGIVLALEIARKKKLV
ncbi:hypothetical protein Psal006b_02063 [Piscirickettsia salmonis]|uniref:ACP S-malonyltransferase n=1 Tax=Piscirickettsia salmonis TaxID=1238 RepID=A0A1L6TB19_PISSA|nr:hypothetical protein [Piscirickettsia salmonis]AKP73573.2 hypothetical protein PSLF89_1729 [Piscirickettsia salmonis LF-89 = ATCC VR-1361]ALB22329.1 ACP S-malonyltransferase [Piscirickettsia salmonis]ALY02416.1 hypothetical protein AWE47_05740 [Piscirickettsia salmonis]AMA41933.1 hypothetical protein AWJ11_05740 [Piscirickettsia salmonis]AOS34410.1 hypothetical protein AVM72_02960 [Piscirickettsia salmonis]